MYLYKFLYLNSPDSFSIPVVFWKDTHNKNFFDYMSPKKKNRQL